METGHGTLEIFGVNHYHNSTGVRDEKVLAAREAKAESLERRILELLISKPYTSFTPAAIWLLFGQAMPITSVRRSLTNLTKHEYALKLDEQRPGLYKNENHCWKWSGKVPPVSGPLWTNLKTSNGN